MRKLLAVVLLVLLVVQTGCTAVEEETFSKQTFALDTFITLTLYDHGSNELLDEMVAKISEIENKMSKHIEGSEVDLINQNAGLAPIQVSDETYYVIEEAINYGEVTDGNFDITMGPVVDLWDIGSDDEAVPENQALESAMALVSYELIELLEDNYVYLPKEGMSIDLGGIAKGYVADALTEMLTEAGVTSAIINLGGNVKVIGSKLDETPFNVGIQNAYGGLNSIIGIYGTVDSTVVTSGNYERYFEEDGVRYHHIFDYKTGYPAVNGLGSVTIITESSMEADALSTAVYVMGLEVGMMFIEAMEGVECLMVSDENLIFTSSGVAEQFILTDSTFSLE